MKETKIESLLITYLIKRGHFVLGIENAPYSRSRSKKTVKAIPDIMGTSKDGKSVVLEVKTPDQYSYIDRNLEQWLSEKNKGREYSNLIEHYIAQHYMLMKFKMRGAKAGFVSNIDHLIKMGL